MAQRTIGIIATSVLGLAILGSAVHFMTASRKESEAQFVHDFFRYASISGEPAPYQLDETNSIIEGHNESHVYRAFMPTRSVTSYHAREKHWDDSPLSLTDRALSSADAARKKSVALMENLGYSEDEFTIEDIQEMNGRDLGGIAEFGLPDGAIVYSVMLTTTQEGGQTAGNAARTAHLIWEAHRGELIMWLCPPKALLAEWRVNLSEQQAIQIAKNALADKHIPSTWNTRLTWVLDGDPDKDGIDYTQPMIAGYQVAFREPDWEDGRQILVTLSAENGSVLYVMDLSAPIPDYPTDS